MPKQNRSVQLVNYPVGIPKPETDFAVVSSEIPDTLEDGQVLLKTLYLSVDPYMRGRMKNVKSYFPSFTLNKPLDVGSIVEVVESKNEKFKVGEIYTGLLDASDYILFDNSNTPSLQPVIVQNYGLPISTAQSCIGMVGLTAYFGLLDITKPKEGETVVVSGAAGAVGTIVGQIAKIKGCRVIGIAGGEDKIKFITEELGFDVGIDYKASNIKEAIAAAAPNGVDVYFDNVGGEISDAVMSLMNRFGRISKCGAISGYNATEVIVGPVHDWTIITKSLLVQGFIVTQWADRFPEGIKQLIEWVLSGKIKYRETIREGLENLPKTFVEMLTGANTGKMLLKTHAN